MEQEIRLARLEEKHSALCDRIDRYCDAIESRAVAQEEKNKVFFETRDAVKSIEAKASGIALVGVVVSTVVSWFVPK